MAAYGWSELRFDQLVIGEISGGREEKIAECGCYNYC